MRLTAKQVPESIGLAGDLSISGNIIRVFDRKSGTSEKGDWSFQNFVVQDETGEMTVCLKNRTDELKKEDVGKSVTISSSKSDKGIHGVKIEKESYTDKQQKSHEAIKVIITPSAKIEFGAKSQPESEEVTATEPTKREKVDTALLRKETIKVTVDAWFEAIKDHADLSNPEILAAVIQAAGRNADTMFIADRS